MPTTPTPIDLATKVLCLLKTDWRAQAAAVGLVVIAILNVTGLIDVPGFIYRYQALCGTVITGAIGFYTVNKTLRTNAENAQKQKDREIAHEREAVRTALHAELWVLHRELDSIAYAHKEMEKRGAFIIRAQPIGDEHSRAYRSILNRLGLLSLEQVSAVVKAYAGLESMASDVEWLCQEQVKAGQAATTKMNSAYRVYLKKLYMSNVWIEGAIRNLGGTPAETRIDESMWTDAPPQQG